ncbi:SGNH/GDSL hydrolase family protein [Loktanella sp. DJP18]|uniref:SGNH/GDSL hydrolase family protein n=1 Tax=Loktanella sp. DJP18 TaxID=3409788 RepID=UPI003BB577C1
MIGLRVLAPVALAISFGIAFGLSTGSFRSSISVASSPLVCRPSAPTLAEAHHYGASILMFGNSQIYDGNWNLGLTLPINCARQGLTARAAINLVPTLPVIDPDAILLGFGAVEVLQAGSAVNPATFEYELTTLVEAMAARWPKARILVATVPPMRRQLLPTTRGSAATTATALSEAARAVAAAQTGTRLIDLSNILPVDADGLMEAMTHDGVHLTPAAYALWSAKIADEVAAALR